MTARDDPDIRFPKRNRIFGRYTAHLMRNVFPLATALGIAAVRRVRTSPMVSACVHIVSALDAVHSKRITHRVPAPL